MSRSTPTFKYSPRADYFTDAAITSRALLMKKLLPQLLTYDQMLKLREDFMSLVTDQTAKHPRWIPKPQADAAASPSQELLKEKLADRLAKPLASMKWLDYDNATDEDELGFLNVSLVVAGYYPRETREEAWELFGKTALGPIMTEEEFPPIGSERALPDPREDFVLMKAKVSNFRSSPHLNQLECEEHERVASAADMLSNLSEAERRKALIDYMPEPVVAPPLPAAVSTLTTAASITALVEGIVSSLLPAISVPKVVGTEGEASAAEENFSDKLDRLCSFGSLELRKGQENKTLERLTFETEMNALRREQDVRKKIYPGKDEWSTNMTFCIDKETSLLVRNKELQFEKAHMSTEDYKALPMPTLYKMKEVEKFVMGQLTAIHEEMSIYERAIHRRNAGRLEEAQNIITVFGEDRAGSMKNKYTEDVTKRARSKVKEDHEFQSLDLMVNIAKRLDTGATHSYSAPPSAPPRHAPLLSLPAPPTSPHPSVFGPKGGKGGGKGSKGGKLGQNGGLSNFTVQWIDGSYWSPSLAGVQAPSPACFPNFFRALLNGPNQGLYTSPSWPYQCGVCGVMGHRQSECPARKWNDGGVEKVNVRWLWENGHCNERGDRK